MKQVIWLVAIGSLLLAFGCAKKNVQATSEPQPQPVKEVVVVEPAPVVVVEEKAPEPTPRELYEQFYASLPAQHTVVKGECLWWIAEYKNIYNDPFMWPLIFKANRDQIKNPDLIYPGQTFQVPRSFGLDEVKDGRRMAGAPKPHIPAPDAIVPADLREELGWGF
ncbi:MAG: LysM peptidoglycan-binding domain-containing protein [Deltaproteobacteria bacterium]|nr:LysM peptidoglycan-binding domain-containing protein [Deltaproteobacteria bacterium]